MITVLDECTLWDQAIHAHAHTHTWKEASNRWVFDVDLVTPGLPKIDSSILYIPLQPNAGGYQPHVTMVPVVALYTPACSYQVWVW